MIRCAVCDDDIDVCETLMRMLKEYSTELDCSIFNDPLRLQSAVCSGQRFGLFLLDIVMPGLTGVDLAREIRKSDVDAVIIFLTSSDEFHQEGFEVEALQYMGKPVDKARLFRALDRAMRYIGEKKEDKLLPVQTKDGIRSLTISQISFVESFRHLLTFHLSDGSTVDTLHSSLTLEKLTEALRFPPFCIPHRGFLVNMNHVDCLQKSRFIMTNGKVIPIPEKQFSKVRAQYADYMLARFPKGDE